MAFIAHRYKSHTGHWALEHRRPANIPVNLLNSVDAMQQTAAAVAVMGAECSSTEELAKKVTDHLYEAFGLGRKTNPCLLIRFFRTMSYAQLPPSLQDLVHANWLSEAHGRTNCLTMLATRGREKAWNDCSASKNHRVVPLLSSDLIARQPMIAQLVSELGISVNQMLKPIPLSFIEPQKKSYRVMYVGEAEGNPSIVSQTDFVQPFGVHSVVAFGGLLASGDMFSVIAFFTEHISFDVAASFKLLAAALEGAILEVQRNNQQSSLILLAESARESRRLKAVLDGKHTLVVEQTLKGAMKAKNQNVFDLILCSADFDDSRMFEFLSAVKLDKVERARPFICMRGADSKYRAMTELAALQAGAVATLEMASMTDDEILIALQSYLPEKIWAV